MKKHWRMVLAVILCAVLCIGYYYYLANKPSKKDATDKVVQNDELAYLVARNISDNYPESVRDVVKLYARITKEYYESDISEEDIEKLGHQARLLFDDELKNTQTDEEFMRALKEDIEITMPESAASAFRVLMIQSIQHLIIENMHHCSLCIIYEKEATLERQVLSLL